MGLNVGPESGLLRQLHLGRQRKKEDKQGKSHRRRTARMESYSGER